AAFCRELRIAPERVRFGVHSGLSPHPRLPARLPPPRRLTTTATAITDEVLSAADGLRVRVTQIPWLTRMDQPADELPVNRPGVLPARARGTAAVPPANHRDETGPIRPMLTLTARIPTASPASRHFGTAGREIPLRGSSTSIRLKKDYERSCGLLAHSGGV